MFSIGAKMVLLQTILYLTKRHKYLNLYNALQNNIKYGKLKNG